MNRSLFPNSKMSPSALLALLVFFLFQSWVSTELEAGRRLWFETGDFDNFTGKQITHFNDYPFVAKVFHSWVPGGELLEFCSGTFIRSDWLLVPAECLDVRGPSSDLVWVKVGTDWYNVSRSFNYKERWVADTNIALIKLRKKVTNQLHPVVPLTLPPPKYDVQFIDTGNNLTFVCPGPWSDIEYSWVWADQVPLKPEKEDWWRVSFVDDQLERASCSFQPFERFNDFRQVCIPLKSYSMSDPETEALIIAYNDKDKGSPMYNKKDRVLVALFTLSTAQRWYHKYDAKGLEYKVKVAMFLRIEPLIPWIFDTVAREDGEFPSDWHDIKLLWDRVG